MESRETTPSLPDTGPTRRGFLGFFTLALGSLPIVGGLLTTMRAGLAPAHTDKPEKFPLCKLSEVPAKGIKEVAVSYTMRQGALVESVAKVVFVTRDPESQEILAMDGECTHLSCPVQKHTLLVPDTDTEAPLTCPCHGGMFSQTGVRLAGPPRTDLPRLQLVSQPTSPDELIYVTGL